MAAALIGAALATTTTALRAQTPDTMKARMDSITRRLEELELRLRQREAADRERAETAMAADAEGAIGRDTGDVRLRTVSGIGSRPFARRLGRSAAVGGYMDLEFKPRNYTPFSDSGNEDRYSSFVAHRVIPFIFAEVTDRVHFGTELEFEYGGEEIKVEFAAMDVTLAEALNFRGGILLSPLGKFNLIHDSPVNDLTERPLVDQALLPTTLSESGIGFFGTVYPTEQSVVTYELYAVNGFTENVLRRNSAGVVNQLRVRSGRGSQRSDNNGNKAIVGRLAVSPFLGVELGGSAHVGEYANTLTPGAGVEEGAGLSIWALDAIVTRGPFELMGEYARVNADVPATALVSGEQSGLYVQGNAHFGHGLVPGFRNSVFTGVVRYDLVDYDSEIDGDAQRRLTLGLNWRPVEETVFKFDYLIDSSAVREGDWANTERAFEFSIATYF